MAATNSIEAFAALAQWTPEATRAAGYEAWLRHVLVREEMIYAMMTFMKVTSLGLRDAKPFCQAVGFKPEPMLHDVAKTLAARDFSGAETILCEYYTYGDRVAAKRFAAALAEAFGSDER